MARWQQAGTVPPGLKLSVNLSARQLTAPGLVDRVGRCLSDTGLSPELLCLEITESALMDEAETARTALGALRGIGVTLAIDDFGTGYSSLVYLRRFPIQVLKIDQAFVRGLGCDRSDRAIVAAVIELARAMGASTVAEGVETVDQLLELKQLGCHQAQGYYWSPPHTPHAFEGWLAETAAAGGAGRRAGWTTTVLIADDRRESRTAVRLALELAGGFEIVAEASDGHTAVELAKQHRPELVILDLAMPVLGGLDALPQIVAACPGATVAILSAVDAADAASAARSAGAAGYFEKGLDLDRLAAQLRALVKVPA
jgi:EAL domain-containing protein (putative c-di-GMP-specific phosphodiesterase class I)